MSGRVCLQKYHWHLTLTSAHRIGENRHVMVYTIGSGKSLNMVLSHVDRSDPSTWKAENALEDMRNEFTGWDPKLVVFIGCKAIELADTIMNTA